MHTLYEHMSEWLAHIVDTVAPRSAQTRRTARRRTEDIPLHVSTQTLLEREVVTLLRYRDPAVLDLVWSLKYDGTGRSAQICAEILSGFLAEEAASGAAFSPRRSLIVPIPLHTDRAHERGFNQIEAVARRLPPEFRDGTFAHYAPEVLVRTRATAQQARLSGPERIRNVRGAFTVPDTAAVRGAHAYLIDDVATTGATLVSAARALEKAGAKVTLIALARAGR